MGRDKATMPICGKPMGMWVAEALGAGCMRPVLALGETELPLEVLADASPGTGPLGALIGAIELCDEVFVAPCDVPQLTAALAISIRVTAHQHREADAVLAETDRVEPLIGIYRPSALQVLWPLARAGVTKVGPRHALSKLNVVTVPIGELTNVNTLDDVAAVETQLAQATETHPTGASA